MNRRIVIFIIVLSALAGILFELGWLTPLRSWEIASGWNQIPEEHLPPSGVSTELFAAHPGKASIHWLGHSGFLIEWAGLRILLDPTDSDRCSVSRRFLKHPSNFTDLKIDLICVSHAHYDHLSLDTLKQMSEIDRIVLPKTSEVFLPEELPGTPDRIGLELWESKRIGPLTLTAVPAKHNGHRHHPWRSRYPAVGYILSDGESTLYFAGDTARQPDVDRIICQRFSPDTAILPIGAFAPRFPLKIHHLSPEETTASGLDLEVTRIIPCHFGTFRLSLDRPSTALPLFAKEANDLEAPWMLARFYTP